jgi:hypothetical protein
MKAFPPNGSLPGAFLAISLMISSTTAWACSTPVYRYAMYNWAPGPYEVYYFQRGEPLKKDAEVLQLLTQRRNTKEGDKANVVLAKIDPTRKDRLNRLPPWVQKAWEPHAKDKESFFLIITPWGAELFAGQLDAATLKAMLDSPLRRRIGRLMQDGNAALLLVVAPPREKRIKKIEKTIDEVIARVGAVQSEKPVKPLADKKRPAEANEEEADKPSPLKVARLTISAEDPAEKWLIRMLMLSEKDLEDEASEPIVFPIFGRGRTLPPLIGAGITVDNLMECMGYVSGPCSCQIKDQNIGGDLLITWNWEATAEQLAANDPITDPAENNVPSPVQLASASTELKVRQDAENSAVAKLAEPPPVEEKRLAPPSPTPTPKPLPSERSVDRYLGRYAVGVGVAAVVVLAGGWLLVVRRP